jgi:hypothetical protein
VVITGRRGRAHEIEPAEEGGTVPACLLDVVNCSFRWLVGRKQRRGNDVKRKYNNVNKWSQEDSGIPTTVKMENSGSTEINWSWTSVSSSGSLCCPSSSSLFEAVS